MHRLLALPLMALSLGATAGPPPAPPQFATLGVDDGLPSSVASQLAQDRDGFIWIATHDGLARYDGVGFRVFRHDLADPGSLATNDVAALLVDSSGRLWCGGDSSGLNRLEADGRHFDHWHHVPNDLATLGSDDVWALAEDRTGAIWVGTYLGGLNRLEPDGHFLHVDHDADVPASLRSSTVLALQVDARNRLWIGTDLGLDVRDADGRIVHVNLPPLNARPGRSFVLAFDAGSDGSMLVGTRKGVFRVGDDLRYLGEVAATTPPLAVVSLAHDADGALWIGTYKGVARLDAGGLRKFGPGEAAPGSLPSTRVTDILEDAEGGMWFSLLDGGVARLAPHWRNFAGFRHLADDPSSLAFPRVRALAVEPDGAIWAASGNDGLDRIDPVDGHAERWGERLRGAAHVVWSILPEGSGRLWIGHAEGLRRVTLATGQVTDLPVDMRSTDALPPGFVDHLALATDRTFWASAHGGGIAHVAMAGASVLHRYTPMEQTLGNADVTALVLDEDQRPWIATGNGIERYDPVQDRFVDVPGSPREPVYSIAFAADGSLWLHRQGALERYTRHAGALFAAERLDANAGWPTLSNGDIAMAKDGSVWVTSPRGLWRVDARTRAVRRFGLNDGLPSPEFLVGAIARGRDGTLYAGTLAGVVAFDPVALRLDLPPPPVRVIGVHVHRGRDLIALDPAMPVRLRYDDRDFDIEVRGLSYANAAANRYRFCLSGFDTTWVDSDHGERVYSQLAAGRYLLDVRAANADGAWGRLATPLVVTVAAPPWATPWAYLLYALVLLLAAAAALEAWRARIRRKHALLLADERRRNAEQLADAKSAFLATMGHEIRTPLTSVLGMTELLLRTPLDQRQRDYADAIHQSGELLLRQVNDSLDLARIDAGKLALEAAPLDPRSVVREVVALQQPLAAQKGLTLDATVAPDAPRRVLGDALRLKQVLLNLVNNALKFTEQGGIRLHLAGCVPHGIVVRVTDTGPGITADVRARVFRRFEQGDGGITRRHGGSGLGLAICRELVELMGGRIDLESEPGRGSEFVVRLPLEEIVGESPIDAPAPQSERAGAGLDILLVEDDATVARVIAGLLETVGHRTRHTPNGLAALAELEQRRFDLALLDLDLPGVDGLALARLIRNGETGAAHLPLVAVTARSAGDEEALCRAAGIDGFLRKPLTSAALVAEIARLGIARGSGRDEGCR
ncbi:MAG TPA: two-component regulator propeller domain-containing protein [Rhodanobacteraceae bacterium]|nr:two-component regulator propeller domain-containing protein [Rhodanobacteraceae bacterium]